MMLPMPLLGRGGVMARASRGPQLCWRNAGSSRSFDREQDHVIARAGRHELKTPEPNHGGARDRRNGSGHLERSGKLMKNTQDPYLAHQLSVFSPRGVTPTSKFVCVLPFLDGDARRHRDLSCFGQEKALRPAREESLYYLVPKWLYRGEYKHGMEYGSSTAYGCSVACVLSIPGSFLL